MPAANNAKRRGSLGVLICIFGNARPMVSEETLNQPALSCAVMVGWIMTRASGNLVIDLTDLILHKLRLYNTSTTFLAGIVTRQQTLL